MDAVVDAISWVLVLAGSFFVLVGALGFIRMPDVYTRMHSASVIDTLGASLLLAGMLLQSPSLLVSFKLVVVAALLFFFGPVASHAIAQAALGAGVSPILTKDRRERDLKAGSDGEAELAASGGPKA